MLIQTATGLLNAFIEPQFAQICDEKLFTVQASDIRTFRLLELPAFAEYRIDPKDLLFPFTGFCYSWHLEHLISAKQLSEIELLVDNASPEPAAYCWEASMTDFDSEMDKDSGYVWGDVVVGFCLREELLSERQSQPGVAEWFRAYPLFRLPTNEELKTVWVSQQYDN